MGSGKFGINRKNVGDDSSSASLKKKTRVRGTQKKNQVRKKVRDGEKPSGCVKALNGVLWDCRWTKLARTQNLKGSSKGGNWENRKNPIRQREGDTNWGVKKKRKPESFPCFSD